MIITNLRLERLRRNLTLRDVMRETRIDSGTLSKLERQKIAATPAQRDALAHKFGSTWTALIAPLRAESSR